MQWASYPNPGFESWAVHLSTENMMPPMPLEEFLVLTLDLETYYVIGGFGFSKLTTEEYVRSPDFEVVGVGLGVGGHYQWMEWAEFVALAQTIDWSKVIMRCHNAHFDAAVLAWLLGIHPARIECTLAMGRALHGTEVGNSLKTLSAFYEAGEKGDEVINASGKRRRDFTQEEWLKYGEYCMQDCRLTDRIHDAMVAAGFPPSEKAIVDLTVKMFTDPHMVLDRARAQKFADDERAKKAALMATCGLTDRGDLLSNEKFAAMLIKAEVDPPMKWSAKKGRMDWAFAKNDPEFAALKDHHLVGDLVKARLGVKSTINETRADRLLGMDQRGRTYPKRCVVAISRGGWSPGTLAVFIKSSGTHTHRWSGAERMNWQNLERTSETDPLKGVLRMCLMAPEGYVLIEADSSQIEARVNAWFAGQLNLVEGFASGRDIYSEFASKAYGRPVDGKRVKEDKPLRNVGKIAMLALGYGMGFPKLASTMLAGPMGNKPITFTMADATNMGVDVAAFAENPSKVARLDEIASALTQEQLLVHAAVCDHLVRTYRAENTAITDAWYEIAPRLLQCMYEGIEVQVGPIRTKKNALVLPNGLELRYPQLARHDRVDSETGKPRVEWTYWKAHSAKAGYHSRMYGGLLIENIIQALARVAITDQLCALYEGKFIGHKHCGGRNWYVVTTTHDATTLCVPEAEADEALEVLLAVMRIEPEWAPGLPLGAEGGWARVYGEIEKAATVEEHTKKRMAA